MTNKTKHIIKRGNKYVVRDTHALERATRQPEKSSNKPLYVMVTEEQKRRYEAAATASGMSMREYVISALDRQLADQEVEIEEQPDGTTFVTETVHRVDPRVHALMLRVGTLEKTVEALKKRVEEEWGPVWPPPEWFDEYGHLKVDKK